MVGQLCTFHLPSTRLIWQPDCVIYLQERRRQGNFHHISGTTRPNPFGLSDQAGVVEVHVGQNDTVSSMLDLGSIRRGEQRLVSCPVRRGDEYCREHGINVIDILKIDVEGAEHLVLNGFGDLWDQGKIGLVQFEYGIANIYSRYLLIDFWKEFERRGYRIGKLMRNRIEFSEYSPIYEDFRGPNYVAVHSSRRDMLRFLTVQRR
jgi:FkbM family methyltransferase